MQGAQDRVITPENTNLYRSHAVVGWLEDLSADYSAADLKVPQNPVQLRGLDGRIIGHASLSIDKGRRISADLFIDYATEDRLILETRSEKLWAWPVGRVVYEGPVLTSGPIDIGAQPKVASIFVDELILRRERPSEVCLTPVGTDPEMDPEVLR